MATEKNNKVGLLKNLAFAGEARADGGVSEPVAEGRFRYFWSTFRKNNGSLLLANLLFLVTLLPLLAVLVVLAIFGAEQLSYKLHGVTDLPYFLSGAGMGLSSASSVLAAKVDMLSVYAWAFLFGGVAMLFASIGFAGMMPVCVKFIWKDSFVCKKDSYGNDVPRVIVEFFRGIKKYWLQMLVVGAIMMLLVAGVGNAFVYFIGKFWLGTAGAGEWILVIAASVIALFGAIFVIYLLPTVVMYDMSFGQKMKNAAIFTVQMFLQNIFVLAFVALPFILIAVSGGIINIILIAVMLVFGCPFYCLLIGNYVQYFSEKIITPVYQARFSKNKRPKKKAKK